MAKTHNPSDCRLTQEEARDADCTAGDYRRIAGEPVHARPEPRIAEHPARSDAHGKVRSQTRQQVACRDQKGADEDDHAAWTESACPGDPSQVGHHQYVNRDDEDH